MTEYKDRKYRDSFKDNGRISFVVEHKKTDIWVAVDSQSYNEKMPQKCHSIVADLWQKMEAYLKIDSAYGKSLAPYPPSVSAPEIFYRMSQASMKAGIGPMSAVAGAVAEHVARQLKKEFPYKEIIIENGGDIYAEFCRDLDVAIFAGASPLSERVGFSIPASYSPLGICTSSGTVGPSLSFGSADAVMIICRDVLLADSYATAFGNMVKSTGDIDSLIETIGATDEILGAIIIKDDKMGITGEFELKIFA